MMRKLRTAAGFSALWDGEPIRRVRAIDGVTVLPGRRVAMHLMAQPDVAALWLSDRLLADQGMMSRVLVTAPDLASGTRMWQEPSPESPRCFDPRLRCAVTRYPGKANAPSTGHTQRIGAANDPDVIAEARRLWIAFDDHVESAPSGWRRIRANTRLSQQTARTRSPHRCGAVLLAGDIEAGEVAAAEMEAGIRLAEHYAMEALRLHGAGRITSELREAQQLLVWLQSWREPVISLPDIYRLGPNSIREAARARRATAILVDHRWIVSAPG